MVEFAETFRKDELIYCLAERMFVKAPMKGKLTRGPLAQRSATGVINDWTINFPRLSDTGNGRARYRISCHNYLTI
jgi:hypothetical protein